DVWMRQRRNGSRLAFKARLQVRVGREMLGQNFNGYVAPEPRVPRTIHLTHAACSQRSHHLVRSQLCSRRQAHFFFSSEAQFKTTFTCVAFVSASGSFMQTIFCPLLMTP